jgi:hypothetical protein
MVKELSFEVFWFSRNKENKTAVYTMQGSQLPDKQMTTFFLINKLTTKRVAYPVKPEGSGNQSAI